MTPASESADREAAWWSRLHPSRHALAACALVLAGFVISGLVKPVVALVAAVFVVAVTWLAAGRRPASVPLSTPPAGAPGQEGDLVDAVIAALPDSVAVLDTDGTVLAANAGAISLAPTLRRGEPAAFALRMPAIVEAIRRAAATGEPQRAEFSERVPLDRWYEAHVAPMELAPESGRRRLLVAFRDLTPLRRVEEMRADFVANASHELRTPLASLSGFIDTLQGAAREDPIARQKFLAIMKEQAQRMARLIDDLLSLSRIELNAHIHPDAAVDVVSVVRQVIDGLQMLAHERQVEIVVAAPEELTVHGDHDELVRVFENLIENALKYGGSGKRVEVTIERGDGSEAKQGEARVAVRDHGPGIAAEHLPRLTERFYRVDVGHSRAEGGTGLGLALVKHILNRHRGRLAIESQQGAGSTFTAYLPLQAAVAADGEKSLNKSII
jgi:two-component system phosphate regulon sensor histidine kinase PhoR